MSEAQTEQKQTATIDGVPSNKKEKTIHTGGYHALVSLDPEAPQGVAADQSYGPGLGLYWGSSQGELKKLLAQLPGSKVLAIFKGRLMSFTTKQSIAFN